MPVVIDAGVADAVDSMDRSFHRRQEDSIALRRMILRGKYVQRPWNKYPFC